MADYLVLEFTENSERSAGGRDAPTTPSAGSRTSEPRHADSGRPPASPSAYRFGLSFELKTRFTKDWDILNVRAMAAGLTPALNDARMRFALPSGISSIWLIFLWRVIAGWLCDDVPVAGAVATLFLGLACLRRSISRLTAWSSF